MLKMTLYYILHTVKNTILKLMKTWVVVFFLVCGLMGGIIGTSMGAIENATTQTQIETGIEEEDISLSAEMKEDILELSISGIIIVMFLFMIALSGKNGAAIFLPADVDRLFPSPMKPQSVLMFRLMIKLGTMVFLTIYLLLFMPGMILSMGYGAAGVAGIMIGWGFLLIFSQIIQVIFYTVGATNHKIRELIRYITYALLGVLAFSYLVILKGEDSYLEAAFTLFNSRWTRFVPILGWIKAVPMYMIEHQYVWAGVMSGLLIVTAVILIIFIWNYRADFYEDAMAKSEQTAEMMARMQSDGKMIATRKRDRADKIKRDGLKIGSGASMFFWKEIYNRFRFAHFKIFTKTSETYLVAATLISLVFPKMKILGAVFLVGGLVFFRSLGNSLDNDLSMPYFRLLPESTWKKLFYSLAGSSAVCFLDMLPGMIVATILTKTNPFLTFCWMLVIVTLNFYSTVVAAFISQSVPISAGLTLKQIIQISFIYFGLIPEILIVTVGYLKSNFVLIMLLSAVFNVGIGMLFVILTTLYIDPPSKEVKRKLEILGKEELKQPRKCFSRCGLMTLSFLIAGSAGQVGITALIEKLWPKMDPQNGVMFFANFMALYCVGLPIAYLFVKNLPVKRVKDKKMNVGSLLYCVPIAIFLMYVGNLVSVAMNVFLQSISGSSMENPVEMLTQMAPIQVQILIMVVVGPFVEELVFRRILIDRMRIYGEKNALILSALIFAFFHGNFSQLFYAFLLGLLFGYVYLRTGKLRYSFALHMIINFLGGIVGQFILAAKSPAVPVIYGSIIVLTAIVGGVFLAAYKRKIHFEPEPNEIAGSQAVRTMICNVGMIVFFVITFGMCIMAMGIIG